MPDFRNLKTVKQVAAESSGTFSEGSLRWMIFKAQDNGLQAALVRQGRRVLIDVQAFNEWLGRGSNG
jgi:hypothetical protein